MSQAQSHRRHRPQKARTMRTSCSGGRCSVDLDEVQYDLKMDVLLLSLLPPQEQLLRLWAQGR